MKTAKNHKVHISEGEKIKLQIDYRTIVVVKSQEALKMWMTRHPGAKIIA